MDLIWIITAIIAAGFLGAGIVFSKERLPPSMRDVFLTGWEFFLIGALIGAGGLNLVSPEQLEQLDPFIALGLGWAGLIFGSQLHFRNLNKIDPATRRLTVAQMAVTGVGIFALYAAASPFVMEAGPGQIVAAAGVVGAAGAISSPTALSLMSGRFGRAWATRIRTLRIIATLDVAPALIIVGIIFCFFPAGPQEPFSMAAGLRWLLYSIMVSAGMAGLFRLFDRKSMSGEENLAILIGFLILISGIAFYLRLSPLFLSMLTGMFLANTLPEDDKIYSSLHATEKPFYVILLIVAGLWWEENGAAVWIISLGLVAARLWLKRFSLDALWPLFFKKDPPTRGAGLALGAQGALSLAIGLNYLLIYPGDAPKLAFGVIAIMTIVNEALAPALISRALRDEETRHDGANTKGA